MEEPPNAHDAGPAQMNYKSHTSANTFIIPITCLTAAETFICPETYLQKQNNQNLFWKYMRHAT